MTKRKKLESSQDFLGGILKVGDFVARPTFGDLMLGEIINIRYKKSRYYTNPFVVCEIQRVTKGRMGGLSKVIAEPRQLVKVDQNQALIYKLAS